MGGRSRAESRARGEKDGKVWLGVGRGRRHQCVGCGCWRGEVREAALGNRIKSVFLSVMEERLVTSDSLFKKNVLAGGEAPLCFNTALVLS